MSKANGGFPPIKYCENKENTNKTIQRERAYAPQTNNVNIRQILKKNNKPVLPTEEKKDIKIDIVDDF